VVLPLIRIHKRIRKTVRRVTQILVGLFTVAVVFHRMKLSSPGLSVWQNGMSGM